MSTKANSINPKGHVWLVDEWGDTYFDHGGFHGGPTCARCDESECEHCRPSFLTEDCPDFGNALPGMEL